MDSMIKLLKLNNVSKGFESRGTEISNRLTAWHNLLEENRPSGRLTSNLYEKTSPRENVSPSSIRLIRFGTNFQSLNLTNLVPVHQQCKNKQTF